MRAVAIGAAVVLVVGVPVALVGSLAVDDGSNLVFPLAAVVVTAFVAGGWLAARQGGPARDHPRVVGAAAALAGYAVVQGMSTALRAVQDEEVRPAVIAANAVLAAAGGLAGGALGAHR